LNAVSTCVVRFLGFGNATLKRTKCRVPIAPAMSLHPETTRKETSPIIAPHRPTGHQACDGSRTKRKQVLVEVLQFSMDRQDLRGHRPPSTRNRHSQRLLEARHPRNWLASLRAIANFRAPHTIRHRARHYLSFTTKQDFGKFSAWAEQALPVVGEAENASGICELLCWGQNQATCCAVAKFNPYFSSVGPLRDPLLAA